MPCIDTTRRFDPPVGYICNPNVTGGGFDWEGPGPFYPVSVALGNNATSIFPNSPRWNNNKGFGNRAGADADAAASKSKHQHGSEPANGGQIGAGAGAGDDAGAGGGDTSQAVFTAWTNGWFTSHFDVKSWDSASKRIVFGNQGGNQGGRGWHFDLSQENRNPADIELCTGDVRASDCGG